ncbi:MAG: ester cyclase [Bryobacterales bacterium]|nr:ester cyclase [Bryobacterales bacterium]
MDQLEHNKTIVRRFVDASNSRDLLALEEVLAPDVVRHCQATPEVSVRSCADFTRFLQEDWAAIPDSRITMRHLVAEGDMVGVFAQYVGTQTGQWGPFPPSGKRLELDLSGMFRILDGKIAEVWVIWDNLTGLQQLGHLSVPETSSS